jgi:DNA repair protein RadC
MYIDNDNFEKWMQRLVKHFERLEKLFQEDGENIQLVDGEKLLDNYDVCKLLNISKRTLQRYRDSKDLPFQMIYHKTFYKESDVLKFIQEHFSKFQLKKKDDDETEHLTD